MYVLLYVVCGKRLAKMCGVESLNMDKSLVIQVVYIKVYFIGDLRALNFEYMNKNLGQPSHNFTRMSCRQTNIVESH